MWLIQNSDKSHGTLTDGLQGYKRRIISSWVLRKIITFLVSGCQESGPKVIFNMDRNFCSPFGEKVLSSLVQNSHFKMNY